MAIFIWQVHIHTLKTVTCHIKPRVSNTSLIYFQTHKSCKFNATTFGDELTNWIFDLATSWPAVLGDEMTRATSWPVIIQCCHLLALIKMNKKMTISDWWLWMITRPTAFCVETKHKLRFAKYLFNIVLWIVSIRKKTTLDLTSTNYIANVMFLLLFFKEFR